MDDLKPKSIIINGNVHNKFKLFCKGKNLKIGGVVEDLIQLYMMNPTEVKKLMNLTLSL